MVIGLISDTHGNFQGWQRAWDLGLSEADIIIHCGDLLYHGPKFSPAPGYDPRALAEALNTCGKPVLIARGNGDSEVDQLVLDMPIQQPFLFALIEGARILATHGHVMAPDQLLALADTWRLDFVFTGHTHVPALREADGTIHINPGTVTYPLSTDPALQKKTFALIRDGTPTILDIDTGDTVLSLD